MSAYIKLDLITGDVYTQVRCRYMETQYESAVSVITIGKHGLWIPADHLRPHLTGGSDWAETLTLAAGKYARAVGFDAGEKAHFEIALPKSWNNLTVSFVPHWFNVAGGSGNVVWGLSGTSVGNGEPVTTAVGTQQTSTDAALAANDLAVGPESSAITLSNTPDDHQWQRFDLERLSTGNTYGSKAYLFGLMLFITTNASTDD